MRSSFDDDSPRRRRTLDSFAPSIEPEEVLLGDVDPEAESEVELNALQRGFAERAQAEAARRELATDSEYWCCLVFQTREQAEAFSTKFGNVEDKYIDGRQVASALGIALPPNPVFPRVKVDRKLSDLA